MRLGPCVAGVGKFICIGLNYADHAAETGAQVPPEFSRPEVLAVLREYYSGLDASEKVEVKLAGHSAR